MHRLLARVFCCFALSALAFAQYTNQDEINELGGPKEFAARRAALCKAINAPGTVLLFARIELPEAAHYREDNDFFYYTGLREPGAVLLIHTPSCNTIIFQPQYSAQLIQMLGTTLLSMGPKESAKFGFPVVMPVSQLDSVLGESSVFSDVNLWVRMGFPDSAESARPEMGSEFNRYYSHPYGTEEMRELAPLHKLQKRYPMAKFHDLVPLIDAQRNIKTAAEQAILRRNGKLGAAGIKRAISIAKPGIMQYQVEAAAANVFAEGGAEAWAYAPIVGSGRSANTWHYFSNRDRINPGEVVVMDFSPDLHQMTMDITRTFPIDGKFTPEQAKWYQADLEAQKAVIDMLKPGNTYEQAAEAGRKVFEKYGVADQWPMYKGKPMILGHWVGLSVHDVGGILSGPIKPGQVLTVEPIIEFRDKQWHFRVEDTILITENGHEILSSDVPKEMAEVEKLVGSAAR